MIFGLDLAAMARASLIYLHLLAFAAAAVAITFGDFAIFAGRRVNAELLKHASRIVSLALAALWATGMTIIWIDTQFELGAIAGQPKLLSKLTVVSILTANGVLLHWLAFPLITRTHDDAARAALLPAMLGGVSAATWGYAAFLGVAKPFAPLGYVGLMALYSVALALAAWAAWVFAHPRLARRMHSRADARKMSGASAYDGLRGMETI
jgi:hypothetical protein